MPIYSYKTEDGRVIDRLFKYSERPETVTLDDGTVAKRIEIAPTARMASQWDSYEPSDLPPVNAKAPGM